MFIGDFGNVDLVAVWGDFFGGKYNMASVVGDVGVVILKFSNWLVFGLFSGIGNG